MSEKLLSLLGLVRKAGMLSMGFDPVMDAVRKRKAELVLFARDLSDKTEKEALHFMKDTKVDLVKLNYTMDDLGHALPKKVGIVSVNQKGFAKKVLEILSEQKGGVQYDD